MPDIFKTPWFNLRIEDTVLIPDLEETAEENQEEPEEDGESPESEEEQEGDRRKGERRLAHRRADESESADSVLRRYRERLVLTKEEFFEEIEEELREDLRKQMLAVREEAYRDELIRQRKEIHQALDDLQRGMDGLERSHKAYMAEFTEELKYMALDIAERVLRKEIERDGRTLEALAAQLVSEVKNASWISVEVSEQVNGLAEHLRTQLNKAEQGTVVYVEAKDVSPDTCRIVTEEGVVDATLTVQLKQLRQAFVEAEQEGD